MRRILLAFLVALIVAAGAALAWALRYPAIAPIERPAAAALDKTLVETGAVLVALGDCAVCHTSAGGQPFAGGLRLDTPFGAVHSTNITPDPETGIGRWSEAAFARALREGVDREGRYLYPAFPYDHFARLSDADIKAIYANLMSRKAVKASPPQNALMFPLNFRILVAGWNLLFLPRPGFAPDPTKDEKWNRGAYLVEGLAHCGACHTPRNFLGAVKKSAPLAGGEAEGWHAPALNSASPAPVPWTEDALVNYLLDGWDRDHGVAGGPMTPVVNEADALFRDSASRLRSGCHVLDRVIPPLLAASIPMLDPR